MSQFRSGLTDHSLGVHQGIRIGCIAVAALYAIGGIALFLKLPALTTLWPWTDAGMSYVFLASIAAAIAAPVLWIGITGELVAIAPIGLNALVASAGIALYAGSLAIRGEAGLVPAVVLGVVHAVAGALLFLWTRRIPARDPRPMPTFVRWAFAGFTIMLLIVGTALVLQTPRVFPWNLPPRSSTVFGFIFLGAAVYFIYGLVRPLWVFAAGQLWGFLAYDIVLYVPYGRMLFGSPAAMSEEYGGYGGTGSDVNTTSLTLYMTVLALSTLVALYALLIRPGSRPVVGSRQAMDASKRRE